MTLGLVLPTFPQSGRADWRSLPAVVREAEDLGSSALWACDHLFWHGPVFESLTALAVAATLTSRCTLGTAVLQLALRSPAVVAKTVASLQEISGGRFVLGVGAGAHRGEFDACGVDFSRRGKLLDLALDELQDIWAEGDGRYQQFPTPATVPVWIGGSGDAALRRAARRGAGWMPMFLTPAELARRFGQLDAELERVGRAPGDVTRSVLVFVHVDRDAARGRTRGRSWLSSLYRLPSDRFESHLVAGEPGACAERLAAYLDAGVEHLCIFVADDDPLPHFEAVVGQLAATPTPRPRTVHP
jgi:alkanesulfonate monooxygenase